MAETQFQLKILDYLDFNWLPNDSLWVTQALAYNPWLAVWDWWLGGTLTRSEHLWINNSLPQWFLFDLEKIRFWGLLVPFPVEWAQHQRKNNDRVWPNSLGIMLFGNHLSELQNSWIQVKNLYDVGIGLWMYGKQPHYCYFV